MLVKRHFYTAILEHLQRMSQMKSQILKSVFLAFTFSFLHSIAAPKQIAILAIFSLASHFYISL
jgi:hypothetical protein